MLQGLFARHEDVQVNYMYYGGEHQVCSPYGSQAL